MRKLLALVLLLLSLPGYAQSPERKVALVIGNADYHSSPLRNPVNDAQSHRRGSRQARIRSALVENASVKQMRASHRRVRRELDGWRRRPVLLRRARHPGEAATTSSRSTRKIETEAAVRFETIPLDLVTEQMEDAKGASQRRHPRRLPQQPVRAARCAAPRAELAAIDAARGTLLAYATAPGGVADDGAGAPRRLHASAR